MRPFRLILLVALSLPLVAHADLYRWIDPASGSVKLSSVPPSDPGIQAEIVRFNAPPAAKPAGKPAPAGPALAELESRWHSLLAQLTALTPQDFTQGSEGLRRHLEAYQSVRVELDRLDPAGAARRRSEAASMMERLRESFAAQPRAAPPP